MQDSSGYKRGSKNFILKDVHENNLKEKKCFTFSFVLNDLSLSEYGITKEFFLPQTQISIFQPFVVNLWYLNLWNLNGISKVYTNRLQRYINKNIWLCVKDSIPFQTNLKNLWRQSCKTKFLILVFSKKDEAEVGREQSWHLTPLSNN